MCNNSTTLAGKGRSLPQFLGSWFLIMDFDLAYLVQPDTNSNSFYSLGIIFEWLLLRSKSEHLLFWLVRCLAYPLIGLQQLPITSDYRQWLLIDSDRWRYTRLMQFTLTRCKSKLQNQVSLVPVWIFVIGEIFVIVRCLFFQLKYILRHLHFTALPCTSVALIHHQEARCECMVTNRQPWRPLYLKTDSNFDSDQFLFFWWFLHFLLAFLSFCFMCLTLHA